MAVEIAYVRASREAAAAAISGLERAVKRWRNAAGFATDIERLAVLVLQNRNDAAITGKSASHFRGTSHAALLHPVEMKLELRLGRAVKIETLLVPQEPVAEPDLGVYRYPVVLTRRAP